MKMKGIKNLKLNDKTLKIVVFAGALIILLLFLSTLFGGKEDENITKTKNKAELAQDSGQAEAVGQEEYKNLLQAEIKGLLENIKGVGKVQVFITLESGFENIYVTEENLDLDTSGETSQRRSSEKKTLLVENENGRKTALLKKVVNPVVGGVVAVCEGGDDPVVVKNATEALVAALCVNTTRICVKPFKEQSLPD